MAFERVGALRRGAVELDAFDLGALVAVDPFDQQALLFEQAFVVGDQLGETLERVRRLWVMGVLWMVWTPPARSPIWWG
jgi:hypothetical protein